MSTNTTRRDFIKISGCAIVTSPFLGIPVKCAQHMPVETFTYKLVDGLEIKADVHSPATPGPRPVMVSIHGGALIMGHREWIDHKMKDLLLQKDYVVVSIDYRLAPETSLPGIIEDLEDAFKWIVREGPGLFNADSKRIGVMGSSAGGYLTLTAGFRVAPKPKVLVDFFGYGDLIGDWYSQPSHFARHQTIKMRREEAFAQVDGPPISDARERKGDGGAFYQYCRQQGYWPEAVSGWDPHKEAEKFYPYMPLKNITMDYPPTIMIHGTQDTDVPYEQSRLMRDALNENGVKNELITIPNAEHGLKGGNEADIDQAYLQVMKFVELHIHD